MPPKQNKGKGKKKGSKGSTTVPAKPPEDPAPIKLSQELIDQIIDEVLSIPDLKSSSLVGRAWTRRSQQKLFRRIVLAPADVDPWLSRTEETAAVMAPWITKFELRGKKGVAPGTTPWNKPSTLTQLIGSLASSPVQHLTITPFHMGQFQKSSLFRCFEPIAESLCSLELRFIRTCTPALTFLISMFPNLDDIFLERVDAIRMGWSDDKHEFNFEYIPSFAGVFEYLDLYGGTRPAFLSWIMSFPLWFHTISPGMLAKVDVPVFKELVAMCAPTLREIPHIMFDADVLPEHLTDILSSCPNLRRVGVYGGEFSHPSPVVEAALFSLRSRHISVIYLEIVETLRGLRVDYFWDDEGWRPFEDFLCRLAEERIDDGEPLVLELGIWRNPRLNFYGPFNPGTILPRFRKRGLIRFAAPPEDPDFAAVLDVKYSDLGVTNNLLLALSGLMTT